jgi:predicted permease
MEDFRVNLIQDLRYGVRQLRRSPGFAVTVLLTVALGVAATTVVFSLVNAVLLRPLPFPEPERLLSLDTLGRPGGTTGPATASMDTSYPNFFDWRSENKSFASMASYTTGGMVLGADSNNQARRVAAVSVSSDFFETLGVSPELGRGFKREEELPGSRAVVLSHETWKTAFNSDRNAVGKTIVLSDEVYTVVGVMPKGFYFPMNQADTAFWITMARDAEGKNPSTTQRGYNQLSVVGRLRPGVTLEQARAEMNAIQQGIATRYADEDKNEFAVSVVPELQDIVSDVQTPLRILFCAVACLLLIVCVNVAGLLLSRMSMRRGEFAIRAALGGSRAQILRQLLVESTMLSLCGGVLGVVAAYGLLHMSSRLLPAELPRVAEISMDARVLGFAMLISLLTGILFGVLPAWRASQQDPALALGENGRGTAGGRRQYRLQSTLVIAETAIGLVLLVGAGLLIRSFDRILKVDPGFSPQQMLTFRLSVPGKRYSPERRTALVHQVLEKMRATPGVQGATAAFPLPLTEGDIHITFSIAGRPVTPGDEPSARVSVIEPGFFETLKVPLKRGHFFSSTENDEKGPPVIIVNEAFAQKYFPGEEALGKRMQTDLAGPEMREIVGVVGNVKRTAITEPAMPEYYLPYDQSQIAMPSIAMRVVGDPMSYAATIHAAIAGIDSAVPIYRMSKYSDDLQRTSAQQRFQTMLLTGFAGIALLLAAIGLYGVLSYMVSQRTMELGLRIALGAQRSTVLQLILVRGLGLAVIGLCIGVVVAAALSRFISGVLYEVKPLDVLTFGGTAAVLLVVSCVASLIPAYRASRLDPNDSLRAQ